MLTGCFLLFCLLVLWPLGSWLQDCLFGVPRSGRTGSTDALASDDVETLAQLDILTDGRLDGHFGPGS